MSETVVVTVEDQSSKCPRPEMSKMDSTPKRSSKHWQDHDLLHKVYHSGISTSQHKAQHHAAWQKHSVKTLPQNLFFEGFKDCASEVIRFLTEVEKVEDNNPLVKGLQSHLVNVSKAICQESFIDLDPSDNDHVHQVKELRLQTDLNVRSTRTLPDSDCTRYNEFSVDCSSSAQHTPCTLSPIVMRSANNSVSDSSYCESEMSTSYSSHVNCQSISSEFSSSLHNSSTELNPDTSLDYIKNDDVFRCLSPHQKLGFYPHAAQKPNKNTVPSLKLLASMVVHRVIVKPQNNDCILLATTNFTEQLSVPGSETAIFRHPDNIQNPMQYLLPLGQSSPVLVRSQSLSSSTNGFFSSGLIPNAITHPFILPESALPSVLEMNTYSDFHPMTNRAFSQLDHVSGLQERMVTPPTANAECHTEPLPLTADISQYIGSILELNAHFLPGIETSSVASGNFADILLAVESCRFHEEPRVRALADELIHLIHDDYSDEDDDDDLDDEDHEEDEINRNDESGIEMMDESSDWGNPVDMIEQ